MNQEINYKELKKYIKNKNIYMILGHDINNQFSNLIELNKVINKINKLINKNSILLYFGDISDIDNANIGLVFDELYVKRDDIEIIMIQIDKDKEIDIELPDFVSKVMWHNKYPRSKKTIYNGIINDKPVSNTLIWYELAQIEKFKNIFVLGGNNLTIDEINLANSLEIPYIYYALKRKYLGDGKTLISKKLSLEDKIGPTCILLN
jgi:hypothetical protein